MTTELRTVTPNELKTIIARHGQWTRGESVGLRAYLTRANLTGAYLTRANLRGANLTGAYLTDANLTGAYLTGANLRGANLTGANLTGADLTGAYLTRADLTDADLTDAVLTDADLTGANLTDANLTGANLTGAGLTGADLTGANLTGAGLDSIRDDLFAVLSSAPHEVPGLLLALREGRVDGSTYKGECACLVGTIANVRGCTVDDLGTLTPNSARPAERWFLAIEKGSTPATNPIAQITEGWIVDWIARQPAPTAVQS